MFSSFQAATALSSASCPNSGRLNRRRVSFADEKLDSRSFSSSLANVCVFDPFEEPLACNRSMEAKRKARDDSCVLGRIHEHVPEYPPPDHAKGRPNNIAQHSPSDYDIRDLNGSRVALSRQHSLGNLAPRASARQRNCSLEAFFGENRSLSSSFSMPTGNLKDCWSMVEFTTPRFDVGRGAIAGMVKVCNVSYHKEVFIRCTTDSWATWRDVPAVYKATSDTSQYDLFDFVISVPPGAQQPQCIAMAACYRVNGAEYWDNNNGRNYHCYIALGSPRSPPLLGNPASPPRAAAVGTLTAPSQHTTQTDVFPTSEQTFSSTKSDSATWSLDVCLGDLSFGRVAAARTKGKGAGRCERMENLQLGPAYTALNDNESERLAANCLALL